MWKLYKKLDIWFGRANDMTDVNDGKKLDDVLNHARGSVRAAMDTYVDARRRTQLAVDRAKDAYTYELEAKANMIIMFEELSVTDTDNMAPKYSKKLCGDYGGRRKKDRQPCRQPAQSQYLGRCRFHQVD